MTTRTSRRSAAARAAAAGGDSTLEAKTLDLLTREPGDLATYVTGTSADGAGSGRRIALAARDEAGAAPEEHVPNVPPDSVEPLDPMDPHEGAD